MTRPHVSAEENIVRAIHSAHFDFQTGHKSSLIFKGENLSVSRLTILSLAELFAIFHKQLDSSPNGMIVGAGEINVGALQELGRSHINPTYLTVEEAPIPDNQAHAEIPQKISKGLANTIIRELELHLDKNI